MVPDIYLQHNRLIYICPYAISLLLIEKGMVYTPCYFPRWMLPVNANLSIRRLALRFQSRDPLLPYTRNCPSIPVYCTPYRFLAFEEEEEEEDIP